MSEEWNFVKAAFAPNFAVSNQNEPCAYCIQFILTQEDVVDLQPWINHIIKQFVSPIKTFTDEEYQNLLVGIIGFTVTRNANMLTTLIHDPFELSQTMEKALTDQSSGIDGETPADRNIIKKVVDGDTSEYRHLCYMLSPEQINAIKSPASFLIIEGEYGTGKTFVLKERTMMLATKYPECKIAYINLSGLISDRGLVTVKERLSLMDYIALKDFEKFNNVDVVTFNDLIQRVPSLQLKSLLISSSLCKTQTTVDMKEVIHSFLKHENYDFVFIDESLPLISMELKCLSIAVVLKSNISNERWKNKMIEEKRAVVITLQNNLRNTDNILKLTKGFLPKSRFTNLIDNNNIHPESPEKNLVGPMCYHYSNVNRLDDISLGKAVINKYFSINPDETVVFLTPYHKHKDEMVEELKKSFLNTHRIINLTNDSSEIESYLRDPTGILLADLNSFQGAQARNTAIFLPTITFSFKPLR